MDIKQHLSQMEKADIYNLGLVLGLSHCKLKAKMDSSTFLGDVIHTLVQREDHVEKRGKPSWKVLVSALRDPMVRQTGIASNIEKKFCSSD